VQNRFRPPIWRSAKQAARTEIYSPFLAINAKPPRYQMFQKLDPRPPGLLYSEINFPHAGRIWFDRGNIG
jgi:hypothetical protein